ncbi:MAG: diguanylate cyclase [Deltaproteobacteria bacterium]|nr:MAG: diguanylate cyclase [Deltaproteobacteria bacterium]
MGRARHRRAHPQGSAGLATWPGSGDGAEQLVDAADKALYRAKQGGRNRVCAANHASPGIRGDLRSFLPGSPG